MPAVALAAGGSWRASFLLLTAVSVGLEWFNGGNGGPAAVFPLSWLSWLLLRRPGHVRCVRPLDWKQLQVRSAWSPV